MFHELTLKDFADAFAQMLAYGLFLAKLNAEAKTVTLSNARDFVPGSFRLIRELVDFLGELDKPEYREVRWVVEEVLSIVNGLDLMAIHEDLSFRGRKAVSRKVRAGDEEEHRLFERDPFIYFYEDYLKAYDKDMRKGRGVYYTPPPIVNFIVRAIDDILKGTFDIADGLADHKRVTVLDFACGTGTFLLEVFNKVFENIGGAEAGKAPHVVREHLLKHIYGFEYLIAPYTIAHLKLSQYLHDKGHKLQGDERLQVFLTNTLEPIAPQKNFLLPAVSDEVKAAQEVKDKPILVITGNPPYSAHSKNRGQWITESIAKYKELDGKKLNEKKHWLQDDYVKFIRFAQMKMDGVNEGVVGIITNHSWLDNPTFRGMRASLLNSFEQIYVLDLHGNAKKKERAPDGSKDENVFDIEQGVAISIFVKRKGLERGVWRRDLWGTQLHKYQVASAMGLGNADWDNLAPKSPLYLMYRMPDGARARQYESFHSMNDIYQVSSPGIITARDNFAMAVSKIELASRVRQMTDLGLSDSDLRQRYSLPNTRGWRLHDARAALTQAPDWMENLKEIVHSPFDNWHFIHDQRVIDWGRWAFIEKLPSNHTLAICTSRKIDIQRDWEHIFIVDRLISHHSISMKEVNYFFPLSVEHHENLAPTFRTYLDDRYDHHYEPEEILAFIYAVLHAPAYRKRYAEFLRIDFPRIPFPEQKSAFDALAKLGQALIDAHLLRKVPRQKLAQYHGKGDDVIEGVRWSEQEKAVYINKTQHFAPLPEHVWNFHIGGYQVLDKYLKSRKGRTLSLDEIDHVAKVADALAFTFAQMAGIDKAYAKAFPGRA